MHVIAFSTLEMCQGISSPGSTSANPLNSQVEVRLAVCLPRPGSWQKLQSVWTVTNTVRSVPMRTTSPTWIRLLLMLRVSETEVLKAVLISGAGRPMTMRMSLTGTSPSISSGRSILGASTVGFSSGRTSPPWSSPRPGAHLMMGTAEDLSVGCHPSSQESRLREPRPVLRPRWRRRRLVVSSMLRVVSSPNTGSASKPARSVIATRSSAYSTCSPKVARMARCISSLARYGAASSDNPWMRKVLVTSKIFVYVLTCTS
mmetsp:Transcript_25990/g.72793  ORF Transcript_25990/g.72793 Transcript_25990/m.72793 type:complete len:259 (+) Transcript_25990:177-953(+)